MPVCPRNQELLDAILTLLSQIVVITNGQMEALRNNDRARLAELDTQLERAVGLRDRALTVWREHMKEHNC
jgi:hypothetical protein